MSTIGHTYGYAAESSVAKSGGGSALSLATSGGVQEGADVPVDHPYFFQGSLTRPRTTAQALWVLSNVVASSFVMTRDQKLAMKDPVVTSGGGLLRFEGFSGCCGLYARVDLEPGAYDGLVAAHGTTNVDFNSPMRSALAGIRDREAVSFAVGDDEVTMIRGADQIVEKKVKLPVRWLKGFVEVQAYKARMVPKLELDRIATVRFLRGLPAGIKGRSEVWVVPASRSVRVSATPAKDGIRVAGLERLRLLEPLAPLAKGLKIYADDEYGETSTWELDLGDQRFTLVLSPENDRGFSGEGQVLGDLVTECASGLVEQAEASLKWQAALRGEEFASDWDVSEADVRGTLALLGSRGLVGYDLSRSAYFHREMPFDMSRVDSMHPRLKGARDLLASDGIKIIEKTGAKIIAEVAGTGVTHRVSLLPDDEYRCTCHWFTKYEGRRGPCKHVLALQLKTQSGDGE